MGLIHPRDLAAWQAWQNAQHPVRSLYRRLKRTPRRPTEESLWLALPSTDNQTDSIFVVDSSTSTTRHAVLDPALARGDHAAILASFDPRPLLPPGWDAGQISPAEVEHLIRSTCAVVSIGHHLPAGARALAIAKEARVPHATVQHGLLTPTAPPAPDYGQLFTWSEADAAFWLSGRDDIEATPVGSQLFYRAAQETLATGPEQSRPLFLGQLHGAEMSRAAMAAAAARFCRQEGAVYRPHPAETDVISRLYHARWKRTGIVMDHTGLPLAETRAPIVSVFSTGVLETAARGGSAWVSFSRPPAWLTEFWVRYGLRPWGEDATPAPAVPEREPARTINAWIDAQVSGTGVTR